MTKKELAQLFEALALKIYHQGAPMDIHTAPTRADLFEIINELVEEELET
tara:strand:+ start:707 stop:856 length:150 start_codon:yes stop_codon:yes gene_type:complete